MMSNALSLLLPAGEVFDFALASSSPATAPAAQGATAEARFPVALIAVGVVVLGVWTLRRIIRPKGFALTQIPGRANSLTAIHLLAPLAIWQGATRALIALLMLARGFSPAAAEQLAQSDPQAMAKINLLAGAVGQICLLASSLAVAAWAFSRGVRRGLGMSLRRWLTDSLRSVVGYLAFVPVCTVLLLVGGLLLPRQEHSMIEALRNLEGLWRVLVIVSAAVLAPLAEEVFFRGLVQSALRRVLPSPWIAIAVASAVFAAMHYDTPQNLPALFALAVVLGYNYERTGRLTSPIIIHGVFNAVALALEIAHLKS